LLFLLISFFFLKAFSSTFEKPFTWTTTTGVNHAF
jgi:hypothetical protein